MSKNIEEIKEQIRKDFSSKGGKARAESLTPERRQEIAQMGVEARKKKDPLSTGEDLQASSENV